MELNTIESLLRASKSDNLEFSTYSNKESVCRTISSFLNGSGGKLILGAQQGGLITHVQDANNVLAEIREYAYTSINPQPFFLSEVIRINKQDIILIDIPPGNNKPYLYKENCHIRQYGQTVVANYQQLVSILKSTLLESTDWESSICPGAGLHCISSEETSKAMNELSEFIRASIFSETNVETLLSRFSLMKEGMLTNAAILLFGNNTAQFFPQCRLRITQFFGVDKRSKILNSQVIDGNLFEIAEKTTASIAKLLRKRTDISPRAVREAVKNALIHTDYSIPSGEINIFLYRDRVEIENYTSKEFEVNEKSPNEVFEINPMIAHFFFLRGQTPKLGLGCLTILQESKAIGSKKPKWEFSKQRVTCTIYGITPTDELRKNGRKKAVPKVNYMEEAIENLIFEGIENGIIEKVSNNVMDSSVEVVKLLFKRPGLNAEALARKINRPKSTVERYLHILKKLDLIYYEGSPKTGGYFLRPLIKDDLFKVCE